MNYSKDINLEKELNEFFARVESEYMDRRLSLVTGQKGALALDKALRLEPWDRMLKTIFVREDNPLTKKQYNKAKQALWSDNRDSVIMVQVLIQLRQNEFNF